MNSTRGPVDLLRAAVSRRPSRALATALVLLVAALWAFGALAEDVATGDPIVRLDQDVADWLHDRRRPELTAAMKAVTALGSAWVLVPLAAAAVAGLLRAGDRRGAALVGLAIAGAEILTFGLKAGFARERPFFADPLTTASSFSFPSGHATVSMALYGALAHVAARHLRRVAARRAVLAAAGVLVLLIAFSRLYLGVHFLSDVLAGGSAGLAWIVVCALAVHVPDRRARRLRARA